MRRFIALFAVLIGIGGWAFAHSIVTAKKPGQPATDRFTCGDTIYTFVLWSPAPNTAHNLEAHWIDPSGKERESTNVAVAPKDQNSWVYLELNPGGGGRLFSQDGGWDEFVGKWKIILNVDGKPLGEKEFLLSC